VQGEKHNPALLQWTKLYLINNHDKVQAVACSSSNAHHITNQQQPFLAAVFVGFLAS
jgi:hypothetical protein